MVGEPATRGAGGGIDAIALDGDKLKPRENRHGVAYGIGNGQAAEASITMKGCSQTLNCMHDKQATVQCYENHAQDSRIKPIEVSDTRNQKDGMGGNNLPLVCFSKVSHPSAPNGEGERWDEREVAQTRNTFDNGEKRCQEVVVSMAQNTRDEVRIVGGDGQIAGALPAEPGMKQQTYVVSTNSNGEDVAPTLTLELARQTGAQQANGGGTSSAERSMTVNFEMYDTAEDASVCLNAQRAKDTMVVQGKAKDE